MKPSWEDSPNWANYLAKDLDGTWTWFESMPTRNHLEWFPTSPKFKIKRVEAIVRWENSLEERP